ncbi:hypothetical protein PCE1_001409 [Barthelona sp. PCE]
MKTFEETSIRLEILRLALSEQEIELTVEAFYKVFEEAVYAKFFGLVRDLCFTYEQYTPQKQVIVHLEDIVRNASLDYFDFCCLLEVLNKYDSFPLLPDFNTLEKRLKYCSFCTSVNAYLFFSKKHSIIVEVVREALRSDTLHRVMGLKLCCLALSRGIPGFDEIINNALRYEEHSIKVELVAVLMSEGLEHSTELTSLWFCAYSMSDVAEKLAEKICLENDLGVLTLMHNQSAHDTLLKRDGFVDVVEAQKELLLLVSTANTDEPSLKRQAVTISPIEELIARI